MDDSFFCLADASALLYSPSIHIMALLVTSGMHAMMLSASEHVMSKLLKPFGNVNSLRREGIVECRDFEIVDGG